MKKLSKNFWVILGSICGILLVVLGVIVVLFNNRDPEVVEKEENGANITLNYTGNTTGLELVNMTPTTDELALAITEADKYFEFSVDTLMKKAKTVEYEIFVNKEKTASSLTDDNIRIYLEKENNGTYTKVFGPEKYTASKKISELGSPQGSMVLLREKKTKSSKDNYRLRMWMPADSTIATGSYKVVVSVVGRAK